MYGEQDAEWLEEEPTLGSEVRSWSDYKVAMDIVRSWLRKHDQRVRELEKALDEQTRTKEAQG